jgi:hypothetical protein
MGFLSITVIFSARLVKTSGQIHARSQNHLPFFCHAGLGVMEWTEYIILKWIQNIWVPFTLSHYFQVSVTNFLNPWENNKIFLLVPSYACLNRLLEDHEWRIQEPFDSWVTRIMIMFLFFHHFNKMLIR